MSGFLGVVSKEDYKEDDIQHLFDTINLFRKLQVSSFIEKNLFFSSSFLKNAPLKGERLFRNHTWVALFAGDIVDHQHIPFEKIVNSLENKNSKFLKKLSGIFAIAAYQQQEQQLYIVSDRRSQQPIYYYIDNDGIYFSTEMSTFCRLKKNLKFNQEWLWEYLFFNFPVGKLTFLKNVNRMPPASILKYDVRTGGYKVWEYASLFKKKERLISGKEGLDLAAEIFSNRIPKYFSGSDKIAHALSGGWDSRSLLALAPRSRVTAYTYGTRGCRDIQEATKAAKFAKIDHLVILFDDDFVMNLPKYMLETVFLSSGMQNILRATLLYVYAQLTDNGNKFPLTISGISFDFQFRGHAESPTMISNDLTKAFANGEVSIRKDFWSALLKAAFSTFENHISKNTEKIKSTLGELYSSETHLSYLLYKLCPNYFQGEISLAKNFTTIRVPVWDLDIVNLSYSIAQSTLSFSQYGDHVKGSREELILQSYLFYKLSNRFKKIPVGNVRPDMVLNGKYLDYLYRAYRVIGNEIMKIGCAQKRPNPLEDWYCWLNDTHKDFVDNLIFSKNSEIRKYIRKEFLQQLKLDRNLHYIGKLATVEIILRLINSQWQRFW